MPLRWEFRLLRLDSMPILACFGRFGRWPIRSNMVNTARFWPNQSDSAWIEAKSTWIRGKKKKKKFRRGTNTQATASDTASCFGLGCGILPAASVLSSLYVSHERFFSHKMWDSHMWVIYMLWKRCQNNFLAVGVIAI